MRGEPVDINATISSSLNIHQCGWYFSVGSTIELYTEQRGVVKEA